MMIHTSNSQTRLFKKFNSFKIKKIWIEFQAGRKLFYKKNVLKWNIEFSLEKTNVSFYDKQ